MNFLKALIPCLLVSSITTAAAQQPQSPNTPSSTTAAASTNASKSKPTASASSQGLYSVKEGNKVDDATLKGWRTWRALACERCHGAEQEGLVGPPLTESMKKLSKEEFHKTLMDGRPEKGMPPFSASKMVSDNWEGLYGYLKGRSDGKIKPGHVYAMDAKK
jgi:mono/diheme cytochrome c family protein